jgi:thymidylate synthase (FAD)
MASFIGPSIRVQFYSLEDFQTVEQSMEDAARTCYKSKDKITDESAGKLVRSLLKRGHHAMLEFGYARATLVCNRGVTHELVRHRLCSFAQESTRYVDYAAQEGGIEFIIPPELSDVERELWKRAMHEAEGSYNELRKRGVSAQIARGVLPIDVKTEIVVSANLREWMHVFKMRCASTAHPHIRRLMLLALVEFSKEIPAMFGGMGDWMLRCDKWESVEDDADRCGECLPCRVSARDSLAP